MLRVLFPPKCVLCEKLLTQQETDLCHHCREKAQQVNRVKKNIPFVAHWTALWYYKDNVRGSIRRFKFRSRRNYAKIYARLLSMKLDDSLRHDFDVVTWVPVSALRRLKRGYDQSSLIAKAVALELGVPVMKLLKKVRHNPPQSGIRDAAKRRANVLGAYRIVKSEDVKGKTILLIDDVVTTGATASECAKTLLTAGAKQVLFAAVATADNDKK